MRRAGFSSARRLKVASAGATFSETSSHGVARFEAGMVVAAR